MNPQRTGKEFDLARLYALVTMPAHRRSLLGGVSLFLAAAAILPSPGHASMVNKSLQDSKSAIAGALAMWDLHRPSLGYCYADVIEGRPYSLYCN